ncbi:hypothetical protein QF205_09675 [Luteimonas composti]|uniref:DUF4124 domain-containing protein n=1 Tax=Luteimonas composti TaxID=398257 RepID=A0ABT6MRT7_9GAMM|nr:hypothetical protein [Luteimonas composti]MDH7453332.1 hypothetical protein [Luteimonas composti]
MRSVLLACCILLSLPPAGEAQAQIRRCVTEDGGHVYTDRQCKDLGASERAPRQSMVQQGGRLIRRDCSRNLQDLVHELTAAIDNRDVNRLAGIYHWPGTSTRSANAIMGRLDGIVNRPLVGILPVQPAPPTMPVAASRSTLSWRTPGRDPAHAGAEDDALPPAVLAAAGQASSARRPPTALVVEQSVNDRITPLQTLFSLRRHLDCWWLSL